MNVIPGFGRACAAGLMGSARVILRAVHTENIVNTVICFHILLEKSLTRAFKHERFQNDKPQY